MKMSCNGCRVLRKGCSDDCSIRPCLDWIKSSKSQANATVFLAKFYGRAGLINLIDARPHHLRPAIFKSLLYESCGRIVNPIFGSVGLVCSGNWQLCEDAVEAVMRGDPITQISSDVANPGPPLKACDIRHINKANNLPGSNDLRRVRTRCRYKRSGANSKRNRVWIDPVGANVNVEEVNRSPSHESSSSQQSEMAEPVVERVNRSSEVTGSAETGAETECVGVEANLNSDIEIGLDLTLGFEPIRSCAKPKECKLSHAGEPVCEDGMWKMELGLDYPASC